MLLDVEAQYAYFKSISSNDPDTALMYLRGSFLIKSGVKEETGRPYRFLEHSKECSFFLDPQAWPEALIADGSYQGFIALGLERAQKGFRVGVRTIHVVSFAMGKVSEITDHDAISVGSDLP